MIIKNLAKFFNSGAAYFLIGFKSGKHLARIELNT
jgi:hypothetical protein